MVYAQWILYICMKENAFISFPLENFFRKYAKEKFFR